MPQLGLRGKSDSTCRRQSQRYSGQLIHPIYPPEKRHSPGHRIDVSCAFILCPHFCTFSLASSACVIHAGTCRHVRTKQVPSVFPPMYWPLVFPMLLSLLAIKGSLLLAGSYLKWRSRRSRILLLNSLSNSPAEHLVSERKLIAGFFHPYWCVQKLYMRHGC